MKYSTQKHIKELKNNGITYLKNVLSKKECNSFIKEFEKTFKAFESKYKKLGNRGQVIQNYFLYNKNYLKLLELNNSTSDGRSIKLFSLEGHFFASNSKME